MTCKILPAIVTRDTVKFLTKTFTFSSLTASLCWEKKSVTMLWALVLEMPSPACRTLCVNSLARTLKLDLQAM